LPTKQGVGGSNPSWGAKQGLARVNLHSMVAAVKDAAGLPLSPTRLGGNGINGVVSVVVTRLSVKQKTRVRFPTSPQS